MLTIYSKPQCSKCHAVIRRALRKGIAFQVIDVSTDPVALAHVKELGYAQLPVCETTDGDHWGDVRFDKIDALAIQLAHAS